MDCPKELLSQERVGGHKEQQYKFSKVELHCHLDGCYRVETVAELAKEKGIDLPYDPAALREVIAAPTRCSSLDQFLCKMGKAMPVFRGDADAITRLAMEAAEDKAKDGIKYIEFRYAPHLLANCDVEPLPVPSGTLRPRDVVEVVNAALEKASQKYGLMIRTILCNITLYGHYARLEFLRARFKDLTKHLPPEATIIIICDWTDEVLKLCQEYKGRGVVGVDVAGPEHEDFPESVVKSFQKCAALGIHRTAHAGEAGPASRVRQAIETLEAERIGHGYHTVDDEEVLKLAQRRNTHFEVCPLSSYLTSAVTVPWSSHPAKEFLRRKMNFGLNTDDPGVNLHGIITDYNIAVEKMDFSIDDLLELNINAARSCFLDGAEKQQLLNDLQREYIYLRNH